MRRKIWDYLEKVARQGHVKALYYCGYMYDKGYGTAVDKAKALMWYEKAAAQGHPQAKEILEIAQSTDKPQTDEEEILEKLIHHIDLTREEIEYVNNNYPSLRYSTRGLYDVYAMERLRKALESSAK